MTMRTNDRIDANMKMRDQILLTADTFARHRGVGRKRVSKLVLNRGSKLDDIADGGDLTTSIFERAMLWFSENWPTDLRWPEDVPRPVADACREAAE